MGTSAQESPIWKQIDDAEYYLVSGSFEQAMLAALSVADQIRTASLESACDQDELLEMLESAGMVLVQALKELRRTPEMFVQLKTMFGSVPSVPARVFLTGATIQMAAGSVSDLRPIFEEYLANWRYTNDEVYVLDGGHDSASNGFVVTSVMSTGQYFQVAELYTVTFLCIVSQDSETAISWAEKADLTEQRRQGLLKKLHAIRLASKIAPVCDGVKKVLVKSAQSSQHVANQFDPLFWWFHSIRLKFGKIHIVLPSAVTCSKENCWLEEMNPLAAVQQVPQAPRGSWL
ncbi:unnamed protein product [Miscanthus lutarioriparius]|uniref:Uncharacterized protein n=1 Tax=Miscanthus lutarioriparius TaxID=422564 RepID=A0A811S863_9POAL|nr:unnamed protein product [Miscanthus lutarioriparius]